MVRPVKVWIVRAIMSAPPPEMPPSKAALILSMPWWGMFTHRSLGNDRMMAFFSFGSVWTSMMVSALFDPPMEALSPNRAIWAGVSPARESLPRSR